VVGALLANALIVVSTMLRAGSGLLLMPLMVVQLGQEHYGLWITVSTVTMYLTLAESGLGQTVVNKIGEAYTHGRLGQISQIMASAHGLYWLLVVPIGGVAVLLIVALPIGRLLLSENDMEYEPLLRVCLVISTILALGRLPMLVFPGLLIGVRKLPVRVAWEIGGTLLSLAAVAMTVLLNGGLLGAVVALNASLLASTAAIAYSSARCGDWARLRLSAFRVSLLPPLAFNSSFFFLISASSVLDRSITALLVPRFVSLSAAPPFFLLTCVFQVAAFSLVSALPRAAQPYVVMWSSQGDSARLVSAAKLLTKTTSMAAALCVATFAPFAEVFVNQWLRSECYPGGAILALITGSFLIDTLFITPILFMVAMNRQRMLSMFMAGKAVLCGLLAIVFGTCFADPLTGIAAGPFAASLLVGLAMPLIVRPTLQLDWRTYASQFIVRPMAFAVLAPGIVAFAASSQSMAGKAIATGSLVLVAACAGWLLVFDPADRDGVRSALGRFRPVVRTALLGKGGKRPSKVVTRVDPAPERI
jgi:O-antigen/teichoic acid export membrane protein